MDLSAPVAGSLLGFIFTVGAVPPRPVVMQADDFVLYLQAPTAERTADPLAVFIFLIDGRFEY